MTANGRTQSLTTQEMELLRHFITHEGEVLPRLDILDVVWDHNPDVTVRTIDNFVLRLRKIVEANPAAPRHILSVRGTGYRFVASSDRIERHDGPLRPDPRGFSVRCPSTSADRRGW